MAINFLNNVDYNQNQLFHPTIENQPSDAAAGTPVDGQLYYNTSLTPGLKVGENGAWVFVGGGVESITPADSMFIDLADTGTAAVPILTASLNAVDGVAAETVPGNGIRYLSKNNKWAEISTIPGTYTWSIQGDAGGPTAVASGDAIDFAGGTNVTTDFSGTTLTINAGNETITLTGDVTGSGTTSIATTISAGAVDFAMLNPTDVITEAEGIENNDNDTTIPTSAAVKAYADSVIVGGLIYQGGFDGSTGFVTGTSNYLDNRGTQIAVNKGWTYTVTTAGTFYGEVVEVGDVLIAEDDLASGTGALTDWTTVQNNIDLASLTQVGIGNVNAGTGISVAYAAGTATVTNTETNTSNTATGTITAGSLSGTVNHTFGLNTLVQTINSSGDTVYCDVTRTTTGGVGTASTSVATITVAEATDITILVQKIG